MMPPASATPTTIQGPGPPPFFFAFRRLPSCGPDGATVGLARLLVRRRLALGARLDQAWFHLANQVGILGEWLGELRLQAAFARQLIGELLELGRCALDCLIGCHFFVGGSSPVSVRQIRVAARRETIVARAAMAPESADQRSFRSIDLEFYQALAPPNLHTYAGLMQLGKTERQRLIESLVSRKRIGTQFELLDALADAGCVVTQATVSRDIRQLGLEKTHDPFGRPRYVLANVARRADPTEVLNSILGQFGRKRDAGRERRRAAVRARLSACDRACTRPAGARPDRRHARRGRHRPRRRPLGARREDAGAGACGRLPSPSEQSPPQGVRDARQEVESFRVRMRRRLDRGLRPPHRAGPLRQDLRARRRLLEFAEVLDLILGELQLDLTLRDRSHLLRGDVARPCRGDSSRWRGR